ncbi:EAL domain-containing protein [Nitrosophilus alvini]|uniref:EAL domain-containing protein n=1 Tax=Nitrosophilus alvini TaxID=2714855 RepID=UPI0019091600|nr:EAL domain-containing protein [Nitrosophilus alvini]
MQSPEKIKFRTLFATFSIIFLVVAIILFYVNHIFERKLHETIEAKDKILHKLFHQNLEHERDVYEKRLVRILNEPGVKEAFKERNREKLYKIVAPFYKQMAKENPYVKIMTFRLEDGSAFLRVHKPEMYGDKLNKKRKIIIDTNREKIKHYGFEVGKLKMTYRIVLPIFYQNEYLGLVEFGIEPASFIRKLTKIIDLKYALAIKKEMKSVMIEKKEFIDKDDFSLASSDPLFIKAFEKIDLHSKDDNNFVTYNDRHYFVENDLVLYDHKGNRAAVLLAAEDVTEEIESKRDLFYKFLFIFIFPLFILFIILNYSFDFFLKKIHNLIYTDELTGLKNRVAFRKDSQGNKNRALVLVDINAFKTINELYGVEAGNEILKQFGSLLESFAQKRDFSLYRISSDEFVFMKAFDKFDPNQCKYFIKELYETVRNHSFVLPELGIKTDIEITAGIVYGKKTSLEKALMALEKAREERREYLIYSSKIDTKKDTQKIIALKKDIKKALEENNIVVYYQPITDKNGKVIKYESLVRMIKNTDGKEEVIAPCEFLELSQKFNLYPQISKAVIDQSFRMFENRKEKVSINLSPNDIIDKEMQQYIIKKLDSFASPERIIFEITEDESIKDFEHVKSFIKKVRSFGAQIAIDDFGSGYSNYFHILELQPDYLKIDGSLIRNIHTSEESKIIVKTIAVFAKELNIKTVAEFIYDEEIFQYAKELGIDEFQGFYFGKPSPKLV